MKCPAGTGSMIRNWCTVHGYDHDDDTTAIDSLFGYDPDARSTWWIEDSKLRARKRDAAADLTRR